MTYDLQRNLVLLLGLLALSACADDTPPGRTGHQHVLWEKPGTDSDISTTPHEYSTNGSYDDNGAEPAPNNGNQNFGRKW